LNADAKWHGSDDRCTVLEPTFLCFGEVGGCNGTTGPRTEYHPTYYGAFVLDPDGNNIEAACHAPE
jgi:hypothetical protein